MFDSSLRGWPDTSMRIEALLRPAFDLHAERAAVVDGGVTLTYRELEERSRRIAEVLTAAGVGADDRVCLMVPKSADAIALVLGVLKAGAVYVPLDCGSPSARLASMIRTCAPCWVVVDRARKGLLAATLEDANRAPVLGVFQLDGPVGLMADTQFSRDRSAGSPEADDPAVPDLAYILFTSGSTGQPKGVPIPHVNVVGYVQWTNRHFHVKPTDRISAHAPLHFDMSVWDMFGTFAAGATLVLVPPEAGLTPTLTAEFIKRAELTQWYSVPSVLVGMAGRDVVKHGDFPTLERVIWGGEAFPVPALRYWMERLPQAVFTNVYGPTEATVNCTYYTVPAIPPESASNMPIGVPIPGRTLRILDDNGREVPSGEIGQLYVGGEGLSTGYLRDRVKTAASFVEMPAGSGERWYRTGDLALVDGDGIYHFHGRSDRQIKTRGYRVELDDVAAALNGLTQLEETAVVAIPVGGFEGMRICAAYVPAAGNDCSAADLKRALARELPAYMLPRRWMRFEKMPKNVSGKIDLARLKELFEHG